MSKFTEAQLELAIITLLEEQGFPYSKGESLDRGPHDVLIKDDLRAYLAQRYAKDNITEGEIDAVIRRLESLPAADLYESNKRICKMVSDGFLLKREHALPLERPAFAHSPTAGRGECGKDLYIQLIDYSGLPEQRLPRSDDLEQIVVEKGISYGGGLNRYRVVNQLEVVGNEKRIPDAILYINGLPLVVFEFKSAIREEATIHDAYVQLTTRYVRDIPELMKYNALCVISDGVNSRMGSLFAPYEFYYTWRKVTGVEAIEKDGISALHTMIQGLFDKDRLRQVIRHFIYFPDVSKAEVKVVCRYPQFYAALKLYESIKVHRKPEGDGKGGTYFGATGCGKSFTMLFLTRLLMKSLDFESPTIVLITDRTDLDDQLSLQFTNAKTYIGDQTVISVESRAHLRELLKDRKSGGVFLTTVHKFTEDTELLTARDNVICISDEAHRSQVNLDQKIRVTEEGVKRTYGFAKHLHDSLPNATYVGFTGTPIDATLDVFGDVVDAYTMTESVKDGITVRIVYEGRAAKVLLDNGKLKEIEDYYARCADEGASEYAIEESKKANAQMNAILGDPDRIKAVAADFVQHYERRLEEGSTVKGKAMVVCSKREIAYALWKEIVALRPQWNEVLACEAGASLSLQEQKTIKPMERVKMIMTRGKDDPKELYDLLGTKDQRKELDRQFKNAKSNFKIAILVDMWLTGFDVPFLDSMYIDKPVQRHSLIQTISRVNRRYQGKEKGLVVDYIGIKKQMNLALAHYNKADKQNIEEIAQSIIVARDHLDLLGKLFHKFDAAPYFDGSPVDQLNCLNDAAEYVQVTETFEKRFMGLVKRMKAAYDICCGADEFAQSERDTIHFYLAVRSIVFKLTKGNAPDTAQMNAKVREMIAEALKSDGVEEIFKLGEDTASAIDIFDEDYLAKIEKIKLPNTKIKVLQHLLARAIDEFKRINKTKGLDFSKKFKTLVDTYNERKEENVLVSNVLEDFTDEIIDLLGALKKEKESFADLGIDLEEKAFYDILKDLTIKYDFEYPEDKLIVLAKAVKDVVDDKAKYTDWNYRNDIKAELKVDLIMLLAEHNYPPVDRDEVYKEIFEQAENFKKYQSEGRLLQAAHGARRAHLVKVGGYLDRPTDLPYVAEGVQLWGRSIFLYPYYSSEGKEWFGFFQYPDKSIQRVALVDVVSGAFVASAPLNTDQDYCVPLADMIFQTISFSGLARPLSGLEDVIESFASLLELYELVSRNCQEERPGAVQTAQLLVNHLMVVARTAFDALQGVCREACSTLKKSEDWTKPLMQELPRKDSFAQVALHGDEPQAPDVLMEKYKMPRPLASFYYSHAPFLVRVRNIRKAIVHRGHHAGFVFNLDQGLAVATREYPWNQFQIWDEGSLGNNDLGSLRKLFAHVVTEAMAVTTSFGEAFASCTLLPEPLSPANHVYLRGPLNHHLLRLEETLASPWERRPDHENGQ